MEKSKKLPAELGAALLAEAADSVHRAPIGPKLLPGPNFWKMGETEEEEERALHTTY